MEKNDRGHHQSTRSRVIGYCEHNGNACDNEKRKIEKKWESSFFFNAFWSLNDPILSIEQELRPKVTLKLQNALTKCIK